MSVSQKEGIIGAFCLSDALAFGCQQTICNRHQKEKEQFYGSSSTSEYMLQWTSMHGLAF
jgi:hypothetical protein